MKRKATVTHTRPNTSVKFYKVPDHLEGDWDQLFADGLLLKKEIIITPLQIVYENTWRSKEDADNFGIDPKSIARHKEVNSYNQQHGIIKTLSFIDVDE